MNQRKKILTFTFVLALGLALTAPVSASDWPQWRGPNQNGKSPDTGLLQEWPEAGPPLAWKSTGLGTGYSSIAVAGDSIYTLGDLGETQHAFALSRKNGDVRWKTPIGPAWKDQFAGPRGTPAVDGDRIYVLSTEGILLCLDRKTGEKRWSRDLPADFGGHMMEIEGTHWKFSESPLVDGDWVIVTPGSKAAALVALDKKSGKEVWRTAIPELGEKGADGAGYSSVMVSNGAGVKQYVQLLGRGVIGVEAATGKFLWGYNKVANHVANIPTPVIDGDHVFVSTGYGTGAVLLELKKSETGVIAEERYFLTADTFQNHHGGMILDNGHIFAGTAHNKGFPIAVRLADGKVAWGPVRNAGKGSAAVTFADGHVYLRYQNGLMVLMEATAEGYREKGSFMIPEAATFSWAHPVIADGKLYLREQDNLFCYDLKRSSQQAASTTSP